MSDYIKTYHLIVQGRNSYSISNETDADAYSDYFPGIWGIKTQKSVIRFALQYLSEGNIVKIVAYNPSEYAKANQIAKALGFKEMPYEEPKSLAKTVVTSGAPSTLAALKKFLKVGTPLHIEYLGYERPARDTKVVSVQTNAVGLEKEGKKSWLEFGKAEAWTFENKGATLHSMSSEGKWEPMIKLSYL